jgi:hypothetical protein
MPFCNLSFNPHPQLSSSTFLSTVNPSAAPIQFSTSAQTAAEEVLSQTPSSDKDAPPSSTVVVTPHPPPTFDCSNPQVESSTSTEQSVGEEKDENSEKTSEMEQSRQPMTENTNSTKGADSCTIENTESITSKQNSNPKFDLSPVRISSALIKFFVDSSARNGANKIETLGYLYGKQNGIGEWEVPLLWIPKQRGKQSSCEPLDPDSEYQFMEKHPSFSRVGWIHDHHMYDAFLSSTDLHSAWQHQIDLLSYISIVHSRAQQRTAIFSLTEEGLEIVKKCNIERSRQKLDTLGFHEHEEKDNMYAEARHVILDDTVKFMDPEIDDENNLCQDQKKKTPTRKTIEESLVEDAAALVARRSAEPVQRNSRSKTKTAQTELPLA